MENTLFSQLSESTIKLFIFAYCLLVGWPRMNSFRKKKPVEIRKIEEEKLLEEIIMKIELERVDM